MKRTNVLFIVFLLLIPALALASSNDELARRLGLETIDRDDAEMLAAQGSGTIAGSMVSGEGISIITEAFSAVTLAAPIIGRVEKRMVKEGDQVDRGDVILELENESESLEADRLKLIWHDKAGLEASKLREEILNKLYESSRKLYEKSGSVSLEELQKSELDFQLSRADRKHLESQEKQEELAWKLAKSVKEKRIIRAAISGVVTRIYLKEGEGCERIQPLVDIVDASKGLVVANVAEPVGRSLRMGQMVSLSLRAGSGTIEKKGKVFFISPIVDPASGLMEVRVEFDNNDGRVRLGVAGILNVN
jgi:RND family efflux transporter MFP subunit